MYKVTIEGGDFKEPVVLEYEKVFISQERGINKVYRSGPYSYSFGQPVDLKPNGHKRACIKLWSGCQDYESFRASGEEWE